MIGSYRSLNFGTSFWDSECLFWFGCLGWMTKSLSYVCAFLSLYDKDLRFYRSTLLRGISWKSHISFAVFTWWLLHRSTYGVYLVITSRPYASHTITLFMPVLYLRCVRSCFPYISYSRCNYRCCLHNVRTALHACFAICYSHSCLSSLSNSDVAHVCVFSKEKMGSCCSFSHIFRSCQHCHLGDEHRDNLSVPNSFFIKMCRWFFDAITVFSLFHEQERTGCFALSDQPNSNIIVTPNGFEVPTPTSYYHMGVRPDFGLSLSDYTDLRFPFAQLISVRPHFSLLPL